MRGKAGLSTLLWEGSSAEVCRSGDVARRDTANGHQQPKRSGTPAAGERTTSLLTRVGGRMSLVVLPRSLPLTGVVGVTGDSALTGVVDLPEDGDQVPVEERPAVRDIGVFEAAKGISIIEVGRKLCGGRELGRQDKM